MIGRDGALDDAEPVYQQLESELSRVIPELEGFLQQDRPPARVTSRETLDVLAAGAGEHI
jgi:hypothetical protein